jgi:hypothetical protein
MFNRPMTIGQLQIPVKRQSGTNYQVSRVISFVRVGQLIVASLKNEEGDGAKIKLK